MMNHVLLHSFSQILICIFDLAALMAASPFRACHFP
jgi:hypothetical protein